MSEAQVLIEFKNNLISFFDELIDQFPLEPDLVMVRIFLKDQIPIKDAMEEFVHKITKNDNELRNMIKARNDEFFLDNNIFDNLGRDKINHFSRIWRSSALDEEDKKVIWKWIDSFVYFGDKYIKLLQN
jgi:hypothetical protein